MQRVSLEDEAELKRLLKRLDRGHATTLKQLDRTDRALDAALRHFADRRDRGQRTLTLPR
jgi:hypothetical protein